MKTMTKILAALALLLALSGCVNLPTTEDAMIQRFVAAPAPVVQEAIRRAALLQGFTEYSQNLYQQPASYPKDPILGIVQTSSTPNSYLRFQVQLIESQTGTMVKAAPYTETPGSKYKPFYWRPGTKANAQVAALIESALAEAAFAKSS